MNAETHPPFNLLIVEDQAKAAEDVREQLLRAGYCIAGIAETAEQAIALAEQAMPDLVLMDIRLQGSLDGILAATHIHRQLDIPVVYTSVPADSGILRRTGSTAQFGYIVKPFQERELTTVIERALHRHRSERHLRASQLTHASILGSIDDGVIAVDEHGCLRFLNSAAERLTGWTAIDALGRRVEEIVVLLDEATGHRLDVQHGAEGNAGTGDTPFLLLDKHGRVANVELNATPVMDAGGHAAGTVAVLRDTTERRTAATALADKDEKLRSFYQMSSVGIVMTDLEGRFIEFNGAFEKLCGYSREELLRLDYWSLTPHRYARQELEMHRNLISAGRFGPYEKEYIRKDGSPVPICVNAVRIRGGDQQPYTWSFVEDITEKRANDDLISYQANFDALTGLPNRRLFRDRFAQEIKKSNRGGKPLALLLIDLDHFKTINDALGHNMGDDLLVAAAERIASCIRDSDTLARLGGDEFAVILPNLAEPVPIEAIERVSRKILDQLQQPYALGNQQGYASASIGVTVYPHDAQQVDDLLKYADRAMLLAKDHGRNRVAFFTPAMQRRAEEKRTLTDDLRQALARGQLAVYYQPIVELTSSAIVKAQALLRWQHPERGYVSPLDFIPIAEEAGLIQDIGNWVFEQAMAAVQRWREFDRRIQVSVNAPPLQFAEQPAADSWIARLAVRGLTGDSIAVEITGGVLIKDTPAVKERLLEFRDHGIEVAINDFGTGFSPLSYLKQFDIDYLKIDRALTGGLADDDNNRILTEAIIVMAHKLGLKTIAEGVETEQQRRILAELGCDYAQGYLFARPLPRDEFEALLAAQA
jgi:diguanylate cyclase (GGDEF)-like protein/PAS domain S-box-containing protein